MAKEFSRLVDTRSIVNFSKTQINSAGNALVADNQNENAADILELWRSVHFAPMTNVYDFLAKCATECTFSCMGTVILSNRLKRADAVIKKLQRFPGMSLARMFDIAGVRLVVGGDCEPDQVLADLNRFYEQCHLRLRREFELRDKIHRYTDYPKESGYRAIHTVVECETKEDQFKMLPIEVQFRTEYQHLWAMAVETSGIFYKEPLKSSEGSQEWLDFFKLCSAAISHLENGVVIPEFCGMPVSALRKTIEQYGRERTYFTKLAAIHTVQDIIGNNERTATYCLLELNIRKGKIEIHCFQKNQFDLANRMYTKIEQSPACTRGDVQVVLISTEHIQNLQTLYPSYFLDVTRFLEIMKRFADGKDT